MNIKTKDIIIIGFALFAIFFGAGNLIFPPYLGVLGGENWVNAAFGFLMSDPLFPILGVLVTIALGGRADDLGRRVHPKFGIILAGISVVLIGPLFSVPRTGATTHEVFVQSLWPDAPIWITSLIFFSLTAYLALNPSKVINNIGKYLTPAIIIILTVLVISAIINPVGTPPASQIDHTFAYGFREGYQTMDALAASILASVVMSELKQRGYTDKKTQMKAGVLVGIVAFALLAVVYLSLTYAGSTVSSLFTIADDRTVVFTGTVAQILGPYGNLIMGICVTLACLTTAVGITSACASFFVGQSKGRWTYQAVTLTCVAIEFVISLVGTTRIIDFASFVLTLIYPIVMVLIIFSLFDRHIKYNTTYTGAVIGAGLIGLVQALAILGRYFEALKLEPVLNFISQLPLSQYGLEWFLPSLLCAAACTLYAYWQGRQSQLN
ncbi:branched-chain amino acid transport system II carrier protein [Aerococcus sanguinicola]|uniref:Branched-chain amino acid transport system carrier protein n=1 Tax=Aerococcus sanguinicola TaxID=119206 RepID=A0A0X8FBU6_9LACT|nr:branched-chain amino acid transport system II carrier protein [Aerococcus sanguinicola]AMB94380.1 branched-chain amino acid transporter [Aerococcus sanguinicola]